jgi:alpha-methylacyl-CoA racemase
VVDVAMTDGAALLSSMFYGLAAMGLWHDRRGANLLDGAAPFYDTYETSDGKYLAVGAIEPKFYAELLERLGLAAEALPAQMDRAQWPVLKARIAAAVGRRTRAEWETAFAGSDACVAPVLSLAEAPLHPQNAGRGAFVEAFGVVQPAPAPRFLGTPAAIAGPPPEEGRDTNAALADWGFGPAEIAALVGSGAAR